MTVSTSSSVNRRIWLGIVLWASLVVVGLFIVLRRQLVPFDGSGLITGQFASVPEYLAALQQVLPESASEQTARLIRILDESCACNMASEGHWRQLQESSNDVVFQDFSLSRLTDSLQALVPSTPMALFLSESGQLIYAGPFSPGAFCNSGNSLVDAYVTGAVRQPFSPVGVTGCYCPVD